jgi:F-type H+-transporting ATPase subunit gamma
MKTYLKYKSQIQGFNDVLATVKTTEKIAASSIHFLKEKAKNLQLYSSQIEKILAGLSLFYSAKSCPFLEKRAAGEKLLIVITSDKGLVGGLWHRLVSFLLTKTKDYQTIAVIGRKGQRYLREEKISLSKSFLGISSQETEKIKDYLFDRFKKREIAQVDIIYPKFISLAQQEPVLVAFLPFEFNFEQKSEELLNQSNIGLPIFEPSKRKIFDELLERYIQVSFDKILLEAKLAELAARTVAMEHASAKTEELIRQLSLAYFKERRRAVTQKQLESFMVHKMLQAG